MTPPRSPPPNPTKKKKRKKRKEKGKKKKRKKGKRRKTSYSTSHSTSLLSRRCACSTPRCCDASIPATRPRLPPRLAHSPPRRLR
jgi:hypothetical protein